MRVMNGRLNNLKLHRKAQHCYYKRNSQTSNESMNATLRRQSLDPPLPKSVQFDESSDEYRCLCGCFHVKTGAFCIAGIELFLILLYFVNALLVLLQQQNGYEQSKNKASPGDNSSEYAQLAFIITSVSLAIALSTIILMIIGLMRDTSSLLIPHLIIQGFSILCFTGLLLIGVAALITDNSFLYSLLNAAPFNDYPGQTTVAHSIETLVRVYAILLLYGLSLILELWFIINIYNCNRYFIERRTYMNYCLAYSTPMKTLNSAR